jgi:hypothetical protein
MNDELTGSGCVPPRALPTTAGTGRERSTSAIHHSSFSIYDSEFSLLLTAFCLLFFPACGYRVAGRADRLPPDIKTIAVPAFVNETSKFRIEQMLASALTREFIERTKFRITPSPSEADAVVRGTVKDVRSGVVAFDLTTGRATTLQIQVTASVEFVDLHSKKVLFSNPNYIFREEYQISQNTPALFEEEQPALGRLSRDFAQTLVTDILENF